MDKGLSSFIQKLNLVAQPVISVESASSDAFMLTTERLHAFLPGQVVALTTERDLAPRLYSICTAPDEDVIGILFNIKPGGMLTPRLARIKPGDKVFVSAPFGAFLGDSRPAWWIAAGTGIAPFRAMIRSGLGANNMLIHGSRLIEGFYFRDEFEHMFGDRYVRCCSQENGPGVYAGRLTSWLRLQKSFDPKLQFFLCGSAEMVVEVRDILLGGGVGLNNIMSEIYF
jgi:ferredoxin/flavodoxin---NADP+ reductase